MTSARSGGRGWWIRPLTGDLDKVKVSASGFTHGGLDRSELLVVTGSQRTMDHTLGAGTLRKPVVRLEFDAVSIWIRPLTGGKDQPGERVMRIRPNLRYDAAGKGRNLKRILDAIKGYEPNVLLVEARAASADDDLGWAGEIAGALHIPTVLALDVGRAGGRIGGASVVPGAGGPGLYAASRATTPVPVGTINIGNQSAGVINNVTGDQHVVGSAPGRVAAAPPRPRRQVNTVIHHGEAVVRPNDILAPGQEYRLGIAIGQKRPDNLLGAGDPTVPDELLPRADRWLGVDVRPHELPGAERAWDQLFLPTRGAAFTCRHTDGLDHTACPAGSHQDTAWFPFRTPEQPGSFGFTVLIRAGAALIHRQEVTLSTGTGPGAAAAVVFRLYDDLTGFPDLTDRMASLDVGPTTLTVNGVHDQRFEFSVNPAQWSQAARNVRTILTSVHVVRRRRRGGGFRPLYDIRQGVPFADYSEHLSQLAVRGFRLFEALFPGADGRVLPTLLQLEATTEVPILQIARTGDQPFAVPWPVMYSFPVEGVPPAFWHCPAVAEFGPGGQGSWPPPPRCPYVAEHDRRLDRYPDESVLCPFGFWGLANILEVPEPPRDRGVDELVSALPLPAAVSVATGAGLDRRDRDRHLTTLREKASGFPTADQVITRAADLRTTLAGPDLDVFYVLCHSGRDAVDQADPAPDATLVFPDRAVVFSDVGRWARKWPRDHWDRRRPLVVLNACHTVELTQATLGNFASAFVSSAGASGVIGTEALIDQRTASLAMELFFTEFLAGTAVGAAIRLMRWRLLAKGSVMGLAYTPYCSATLRLRPHTTIPLEVGP